MTINIFLNPGILMAAEEFNPRQIGLGYGDYLNGKIQNGYYIKTFVELEERQKERISKRNEVEKILNASSQASPTSASSIAGAQEYQKTSSDNHNTEISGQRQQRIKAASAEMSSGFTYIPSSDGKITYFKDGLPVRITNERVVDESGNVSIKNTDNMQYNDRRLLTSYQANLTDNMGNTSLMFWYGARYTDDSMYYGNKDTVANKNMLEYYLKEIDPAGNIKITSWNALNYDGKFVRSFHQRIEDSIYGISDFTRSNIQYRENDLDKQVSYHEEGYGTDNLYYTLDRSGVEYNDKNQIMSYHEEKYITQIDGNRSKITTDTQIKYLHVPDQFGTDVEEKEPDRPIEVVSTTTTEHSDGSVRQETSTTSYTYENYQLTAAKSHTDFEGKDTQWYQYTDAQGHTLARAVDGEGNSVYMYFDPQTREKVFVPENLVTVSIKDGKRYKGSSDTDFEILFGRAMNSSVETKSYYYDPDDGTIYATERSVMKYTNGLVNNLLRTLEVAEHTESAKPPLDLNLTHSEISDVATVYSYDSKGNLTGAHGKGSKKGFEYEEERGWRGEYNSVINVEYDVILGKANKTGYKEERDYKYR